MSGSRRIAPLSAREVRLPGPVPECPQGWSTGPPHFVGVGVQRCGTTRWFDLIVEHPDVSAPPATRKEQHFFDRFHDGGFSPADAELYGEYFPRPPGLLTGEWTPTYMTDFWVAPLLAAAAPAALLVVLLRDPVDRYLSGLRRRQRVAEALGAGLDQNAPHDEYSRGLYGEQLARLLAHVDRERVLVLQYERCVRDPQAELRKTFEFLGLPAVEVGQTLIDRHPNRQPEKPRLDSATLQTLADAYLSDVLRLLSLWPGLDVAVWPHFAHLRA